MPALKNFFELVSPRVPRHHSIGSKCVREDKLLAEGGYGFVWTAKDIYTQEVFALKKILCQDEEKLHFCLQEIATMVRIGKHPNLVQYFGSCINKVDEGKEVLILMEFCDGGRLIDVLDNCNGSLGERKIIKIMQQLCRGVSHLHNLNPPIAHRDLKVENILVANDGTYKLCDFGSCTSNFIDPKECSKQRLAREKELIEKQTTMMYRSPELVDFFRKFPLSEKIDIWMLGCLLFTMMFYKHPFQDQSPLAICNANFHIPSDHCFNEKFIKILYWALSVDPTDRPSIKELSAIFDAFNSTKDDSFPQKVIDSYHRTVEYDASNKLISKLEYVDIQVKPIVSTKRKKKGKVKRKNLVVKTNETKFFTSFEDPWAANDEKSNPLAVEEETDVSWPTPFVHTPTLEPENWAVFDKKSKTQVFASIFKGKISGAFSGNRKLNGSDAVGINDFSGLEFVEFNQPVMGSGSSLNSEGLSSGVLYSRNHPNISVSGSERNDSVSNPTKENYLRKNFTFVNVASKLKILSLKARSNKDCDAQDSFDLNSLSVNDTQLKTPSSRKSFDAPASSSDEGSSLVNTQMAKKTSIPVDPFVQDTNLSPSNAFPTFSSDNSLYPLFAVNDNPSSTKPHYSGTILNYDTSSESICNNYPVTPFGTLSHESFDGSDGAVKFYTVPVSSIRSSSLSRSATCRAKSVEDSNTLSRALRKNVPVVGGPWDGEEISMYFNQNLNLFADSTVKFKEDTRRINIQQLCSSYAKNLVDSSSTETVTNVDIAPPSSGGTDPFLDVYLHSAKKFC